MHVVRPAAGGMVTHLRLLCAGLVEQGVEVVLAAPAGFALDSLAVPIHPIPIESRPNPFMDLSAVRQTAALAANAYLLHGHGLRGAWIAAHAARFARKPFIFTAHNLAPANAGFIARVALQFVIRKAAKVICVSNAVAQSLAPFGLQSAFAEVIPNGIDLAPFDETRSRAEVRGNLAISEHAPMVVSVGRLSKEKGFLTLARAACLVLKELPDGLSDVYFVLAGEGPDRGFLEHCVRELEIEDRFKLIGRCEDVPGLLAASDLVAIPSWEEGQGLVALEAMAARRAVVATRVGGLAESVVDGETGRLVARDNPTELVLAIQSLLKDPETTNRMGDAGRKRVENLYTADRMVERTIALYRSVTDEKIKNL